MNLPLLPGIGDGTYYWRSFTDHPWSTGNIGLPSSHTMVAFAGAGMASYLFPRTWPAWMLLGGCSLSAWFGTTHDTAGSVPLPAATTVM